MVERVPDDSRDNLGNKKSQGHGRENPVKDKDDPCGCLAAENIDKPRSRSVCGAKKMNACHEYNSNRESRYKSNFHIKLVEVYVFFTLVKS